MQLNMCTMCGRLCKTSRWVEVAVEERGGEEGKVAGLFEYWQTGTVGK